VNKNEKRFESLYLKNKDNFGFIYEQTKTKCQCGIYLSSLDIKLHIKNVMGNELVFVKRKGGCFFI
jgi:hypothetical protein